MNIEFVKQAVLEASNRSTNILKHCSIGSQVQHTIHQWGTCYFCSNPSVCIRSDKKLRQVIGVCEEHKEEQE